MKLTQKMTLGFLLVALVPLLAFSMVTSHLAQRALTDQVHQELRGLAVQQRARIEDFAARHHERLNLVATRTHLRISLRNHMQQPQARPQIQSGTTMKRILADALPAVASFEEIWVFAPDGKVVAATDPTETPRRDASVELLRVSQPRKTTRRFFVDGGGNLKVYLSTKLELEEQDLGLLVIRANTDELTDLLSGEGAFGKTTEFILAKRNENGDALFLTPLRFEPNAALNRTVSKDDLAAPITQALRRNTGAFADVLDYRGKPVLAVAEYLPEPDWGLVVKIDKAEAYAPVYRLHAASRLAILASIVLVAIVSLAGSRAITRPLVNLTRVVDRIRQGDYSHRGDEHRQDEIGLVARTIHAMSDELIAANEQLEKTVEQRTARLRAANEELEAFSYSVSHDLRAPLRHIGGFVEMLDKRASGQLDTTCQRYLQTIAESTDRAGKMVDQLLAFSRMGRSDLNAQPVDMQRLVREVQQDPLIGVNGRDITWRIGSLPTVEGDKSLLRLVLINLLSNALKFTATRPKPKIVIDAKRSEDKIIFAVRDNGVGFEMQFADKLFGVFQRLHRREQFDGVGIGLANVRRIVQRHGGQTWAQGKLNVGAEFFFSLPTYDGRQ